MVHKRKASGLFRRLFTSSDISNKKMRCTRWLTARICRRPVTGSENTESVKDRVDIKIKGNLRARSGLTRLSSSRAAHQRVAGPHCSAITVPTDSGISSRTIAVIWLQRMGARADSRYHFLSAFSPGPITWLTIALFTATETRGQVRTASSNLALWALTRPRPQAKHF